MKPVKRHGKQNSSQNPSGDTPPLKQMQETSGSNHQQKDAINQRASDYENNVTIQAGDQCIPANKEVLSFHSKFFETMFQCNLKERYHDRVVIGQFDGNAIKLIVEYMYCDCIDLNSHNAEELLAAADFLLMDDVKELCFNYLESDLTIDNCISIFQLFLLYRNPLPKNKLFEFVQNNIDKVFQTNSFRNLNKTEFVSFALKLNELEKCTAVVNWISKEKSRVSEFATLSLSLELESVSVQFLEEYLRNESYDDCFDAVVLARLKYLCPELSSISVQFLDELFKKKWVAVLKKCDSTNAVVLSLFEEIENSSRCENRYKSALRLLCHGTKNQLSLLETYIARVTVKNRTLICRGCIFSVETKVDRKLPTANKTVYEVIRSKGAILKDGNKEIATWKNQKKLFSAITFGDYLIVSGGWDGNARLNSVELYEFRPNQLTEWVEIFPMKHSRIGHSLVVADETLFALGGWNENGNISASVERLDDLYGEWIEVQPMNIARIFFAAVFYGGFIYVIGGWPHEALNTVERYNIVHNQWSLVSKTRYGRYQHSAGVVDGKIIVSGGRNENCYETKSIDCYDPAVNVWTPITEEYGPYWCGHCTGCRERQLKWSVEQDEFR